MANISWYIYISTSLLYNNFTYLHNVQIRIIKITYCLQMEVSKESFKNHFYAFILISIGIQIVS